MAGDYDIEIGVRPYVNAVTTTALMSYDIGGTGAVDADAITYYAGNTADPGNNSGARLRRKTGLTAVTLTSKYKTGAGTATFSNRWMRVAPVRVG